MLIILTEIFSPSSAFAAGEAPTDCPSDPEQLKAIMNSDDSAHFFSSHPACISKFSAYVKLGKIKLDGNTPPAAPKIPQPVKAIRSNGSGSSSIGADDSGIVGVPGVSSPSGGNPETDATEEVIPPIKFFGEFKEPSKSYQTFEFSGDSPGPAPAGTSDAPTVIEFEGKSKSNKKDR